MIIILTFMQNSELPKKIPAELISTYREFTRGKYNKFKLQFPTLTQTDIASMIIREWEGLSKNEKIKLKQQIVDNEGSKINTKSKNKYSTLTTQPKCSPQGNKIVELQISEKSKQNQNDHISQPKNKNQKTKRKIFAKQQQHPQNEQHNQQKQSEIQQENGSQAMIDYQPQRANMWDEETSKMNSQNIIKSKKKQIKKIIDKKQRKKQLTSNQTEYYTFSKYYFETMKLQHPNWSNQQLKSIVKLLWKKRKLSLKDESNQKQQENNQQEPRTTKNDEKQQYSTKISGKMKYRKQKQLQGLQKKQILQIWKKLPYESKQYWKLKGTKSSAKIPSSSNLRFMTKPIIQFNTNERQNTVDWMHNQMKN